MVEVEEDVAVFFHESDKITMLLLISQVISIFEYISMRKSKNQRDIESVNVLKEEFGHLSSERIARILLNFSRSNKYSVAYKQILKDRGIDDYLTVLISDNK